MAGTEPFAGQRDCTKSGQNKSPHKFIFQEELTHALANAERRLADVEKSDSERTAREQRLRAELAKTEALLADERELAEEATAEFERRTLAEIEKLRTELAAKEVALEEALERAEELADRLGEAEHRLAKAGELCRRLNAELDELRCQRNIFCWKAFAFQ